MQVVCVSISPDLMALVLESKHAMGITLDKYQYVYSVSSSDLCIRSYRALSHTRQPIRGLTADWPTVSFPKINSQAIQLTPRMYGNERSVPMKGVCRKACNMTGKNDLSVTSASHLHDSRPSVGCEGETQD